MEDLINRYKKQLKDRVSLKKTLNKTEEQIILDNFKYFDLNSTNFSNVNDFIKVNERIGVKMRNRDELVKVFSYYDNNNLGLINYRIFSKQILTSFPLENNFVDEKYNDFPYPNFTYDKIRSRRDNYIMRNKTSKDNYIFKCNYNDAQSNNLKSISNNYNTNLNNGAYTKKYSSYNNYEANNGELNNYNSNYNKEENHYNKYESFDYKINGNEMGIISKNPNYNIPLKDQPFYGKLMSYLLNNSNLPSKTLLLLYKNFKINQKSKLYNKISVEDFMDIITKNRINLQVKEIQTLFYIYQNQKDGKFYYENFFDDLIDLYWNIERFNFTKNKIREILRKNRNRDKFMENNKITVEDFYNLISITKNNNYNIIAVNNYFKNKLNISYPDEYYNELVRIFMEMKYLSTTNKDSSLDNNLNKNQNYSNYMLKLAQNCKTILEGANESGSEISTQKEKNLNIEYYINKQFILCPIENTTKIKIITEDESEENIITLNFPENFSISSFLYNCSYCNHNKKLFISGGIINPFENKYSNLFYMIDLYNLDNKTNSYIYELSPMKYGKNNHSMIGNGNDIYAVGGENSNIVEKYDIINNNWIELNSMVKKRSNSMLAIDNDYLYAFFGKGENNKYPESIERLNIKNNNSIWEIILFSNPSNIDTRCYGCGIYQIDELIYFFGGRYNEILSDEVVFFNTLERRIDISDSKLKWKQSFRENNLFYLGKKVVQISDGKFIGIYLNIIVQ
jgi:Ca2+-binding EF-hand superfamily protein